jgi:hypothetical protein
MSGTSPKQLEANWRNAQRSTGPQTPCDGVAAIPNRGSQTSALKPFGVREDMPVERIAVVYRRRFVGPNSRSSDIRMSEPQGFRPTKAIEHQLYRAMYSLQDQRGLSHPQPSETPPIDEK